MPDNRHKVEFIELYIKHGNTDYEWCDNHGELIRCKDCKYYYDVKEREKAETWLPCMRMVTGRNWFCADGEREESE